MISPELKIQFEQKFRLNFGCSGVQTKTPEHLSVQWEQNVMYNSGIISAITNGSFRLSVVVKDPGGSRHQ